MKKIHKNPKLHNYETDSKLASKDFWESRSSEYKSNINSVLIDRKAIGHQETVKKFLSPFKAMSAVDVACGYGRFSDCFDKYTGIDFCEKFIEIAKEKNPGKNFVLANAHTYDFEPVDIVFSVISLSSLIMTPWDFNDKFKDKAKYAVMVFELNDFYIFPKI